MNFLGLISFLEKVPKPLISTFSSRATASVIDSIIISIAADIFCFDSFYPKKTPPLASSPME